MTFDAEKFGRAVGEQIKAATDPLRRELERLTAENTLLKERLAALPDFKQLIQEAVADAVAAMPVPKDGKDGEKGERGEKGMDGIGQAGCMIDRDGCLVVTLTNGEVKNLGVVVGKDGQDGISFESFDFEYIAETHEICVKASCGGRAKELRYPAGGIRPAGYWRDGDKAKAGDAYIHDGSLWIATKACTSKPATNSEDWVLAARKGRDYEAPKKPPSGTIPLK